MSEAPVTTEPVVREVRIEAAPETVFGFFTEPEKMTRWLCESATSDPRPGGVLEQVHHPMDGDDKRFHMRGEFVEVSFPTRVVFTWGWEEPELGTPAASSTVEVTLEPVGSATVVRLVHTGLPEASRASHDEGWEKMLGRLRAAVSGTD